MRHTRFVAALVAFLLAIALPLVSLSGAPAVASGHAAAAERAKASVSIHFAANGAKAFRLSGAVKPKAKGKAAVLLKASKLRGHYSKVKTTHTDKQGRYTFSGLKKIGYYAVRIGNTTSKVIHVCKGNC